MTRFLSLTVAVAALLSTDAQAAGKIYKCKNEKGEIFYSQSYDAAHCGGGGAQLNDQGLSVKTYDRIKTPEEVEADKIKAAEQAAAQKIIDEQHQADVVLIQSYSTEEDLKRAHDQQMQGIDQSISTTLMQVESQQKTLAELLSTAAESERAGTAVQPAVATNIGKVRKQIEEQNQFIARKEEEKVAANKEFDATLKHYRELQAKQPGH